MLAHRYIFSVSHSRFLPTPADSVLSRRQPTYNLVKPPKNLQAIASRNTSQPLALH